MYMKMFPFTVLLLLLSCPLLAQKGRVPLADVLKKMRPGYYLLSKETINIKALPSTVDRFIKMRDKLATSPKGGYAMFVVAMILYARDETLGTRCFITIMDRSYVKQGGRGIKYKGYTLNRNGTRFFRYLKTHPYLGHIYIQKTDVRNKYALPKGNYTIRFNQATVRGKNRISLYAFTTSGNRPRPITLQKNNRGLWKAYGFSSVFTGPAKVPETIVDDDL
jgi:hypothetical protein